MPRPFDVRTTSPASMTDIHAAFCDEAYWLARLAEFGGDTMTLDAFRVDTHGSVAVATTQDLRHDLLPGVLAKVFRGDLKIVREESWYPADDRIDGEVRIAASGVPGSGQGSAVLTPASDGSTLRFTGTLEVRIPLVGGRIEKYIGDVLAEEIPAIQRFTSGWVLQRG